uniref:Uncharacterized protein n=2 Tax=Caenorhabditis japonica TaxID=281687 RepID=A0A8R1IU28_CAEJA
MFGVLLFCEIMICLFSTVHLITKCSKNPKSSGSTATAISNVERQPEVAPAPPAAPPAAAEVVKKVEPETKPIPVIDLKPRNKNGGEKSMNSAFNEATTQQDSEMPSQHV